MGRARIVMGEYFCPKCGKWRDGEVEDTGWCPYCTAESEGKKVIVCEACSRMQMVFARNGSRFCSTCKSRMYDAMHPERKLRHHVKKSNGKRCRAARCRKMATADDGYCDVCAGRKHEKTPPDIAVEWRGDRDIA